MQNLLKKLWKGSKPDKPVVFYDDVIGAGFTPEQLEKLRSILDDTTTVITLPEGDGKAEFLPDMTDAEVLEYERNERLGWKHFKLPWQNDDTQTPR